MSPRATIKSGFTILELLIVIAIFAITAASTLPFLGRFQQTETIHTVAADAHMALIRTRNRAQTGQQGTAWGVRFQQSEYIIFSGSSFANRNPAQDSAKQFPKGYGVEQPVEIVFASMSGRALQSGSVAITHAEGESQVIDVNEAGGIEVGE